jgi:hypothetical protein
MKSSTLRKADQVQPGRDAGSRNGSGSADIGKGFRPQSTRQTTPENGHVDSWLRMFTEEEVSELLQVSLSQLRKWRMKKNQSKGQGPPFRKIGRLVRYPGRGLHAYVNGEEGHDLMQE